MLGLRRFLVPFRLVQRVGLAVTASCAVYRRRLVHGVAAVTLLTLWVAEVLFVRFRAGEFDFPR